jgi:hypothetical protein
MAQLDERPPARRHVTRSALVDADPRHIVARRAQSGHSVAGNAFVRLQTHRRVAQAWVSG